MITNRHGLIKFHESNNILSQIVFYADFYMIDAELTPKPAIYAILHKSPNQKNFISSNYKNDKHESCICKILMRSKRKFSYRR